MSDETSELESLREQVRNLQQQNTSSRTERITAAVEQLVIENKLSEPEVPAALKRALADETYINELQARPVNPPEPSFGKHYLR